MKSARARTARRHLDVDSSWCRIDFWDRIKVSPLFSERAGGNSILTLLPGLLSTEHLRGSARILRSLLPLPWVLLKQKQLVFLCEQRGRAQSGSPPSDRVLRAFPPFPAGRSALCSLGAACQWIPQLLFLGEVCCFGRFLSFSPGLCCRFFRLNQHPASHFLWMAVQSV